MNKLAIVIPYYKIVFFEETLKSVASQTDKRFTLYIGNDASPDDPFPLIEKYFPEGNYHYFDYKENLGGTNLAMQWERILENVKEEWFQILGDDDVISENFVAKFYENVLKIKEYNISVIRFSQHWIDENNEPINSKTKFPEIISSEENWRSKHFLNIRSSLSEYIFSKKQYKKKYFKKFPLAWFSDDIAVLEISNNKGVFFIEKAEVKVRISSLNISSLTTNEKEKEEAKFLYNNYILNNYYYFLSNDELLKLIDIQIYNTWEKKKINLELNLFKIYFKTKNWKRLVKLPKLYIEILLNK